MVPRRPGHRRHSRSRIPVSTPKPPPAAAARRKSPASSPKAGATPGTPKDPLLGRVIGRCRIEERIGQGRTAIVYRAHHQALDRTVAVKVLLQRAGSNPQLVERFETEARAIARIDNENVLKIYDVGQEGPYHFIVMELLEGEEVFDIVTREGRMEIMDALRVARQALNGLKAAHALHIVHRDVKPQNLVLLEDGTVKLVDFGLAASMEQGGTEKVGTPHFMAPETCESGVTSEASDVYSLGISLYMLLVGQPPYSGQDIQGILRSHIRGDPLRPEARRPGLPREVADLVRRMTARDPSARPPTNVLLAELDRFGGEALQEKGTLRRRSARMRSHIAARKQASAAPMILAVVIVAGLIFGVIALTSARKSSETTPAAPPTAGTTQPLPPGSVVPVPSPAASSVPSVPATPAAPVPGETPPPPPPPPAATETPEQRAAAALAEVEQWARDNWHAAGDDGAVVARYQRVASENPGTAAGKEAARRATQIRLGRLHANPDVEKASAKALEEAKAKWKEVKPKVEDLVAQHEYLEARKLLPEGAQDAKSDFGAELRFWRDHLTNLIEFQTQLTVFAPKVPDAQRRIDLADAKDLLVTAVTPTTVTVEVNGRPKSFPWADVPAEQIAELARKAFEGASPDHYVLSLAFAYAHDLKDAFATAEYDLLQAGGTPDKDYMVKEYERRMDER